MAALARLLLPLLILFLAPARTEASANLMVREASPYLQLHAKDLVHWRPWGEAAIKEAVESGKPIFLSIGYLSCHWCHVMRRESFVDPDIADIINTTYIPVLIDREEMPALDSSFQSAAVLLGLGSGWPLTLFLTPEGKPFWGGTYFPKEPLRGMPPFASVLQQIATIYREQPDAVANNADGVTAALRRISSIRPGKISMTDVDAAAKDFAGRVNPFFGGFGEAPLFPMTVAQELLWRAYLRTGDPVYEDAVTTTLDAMARGGVYDQVGGGFFRYAVDPVWNVPHFEKMLNVNAALLKLMTDVWRETGDDLLKRRIRETVAFLLSEMRLDGGAFASALDADSAIAHDSEEEEEGAFYVWHPETLKPVSGHDTELFLQLFDIAPTETGEEGDPGTLYQSGASLEDIVKATQMDEKTINQIIDKSLTRLKLVRDKRPRPRRDDKVLADWNAIAILGLTEAGLAFNKSEWIDAAETTFSFIVNNLTDADGRLHHSWAASELGEPALLRDLAAMADAALSLYQATGKDAYLSQALEWVGAAIDGLWDSSEAGFFATGAGAAPQLVRLKPVYDGPEAAGNPWIIDVMARLYYLSGDNGLFDRAQLTLDSFSGFANEHLLALSGLLNAAETLSESLQIVVIGKRGETDTDALLSEIHVTSLPVKVLQVVAPGRELPEGHPARFKEQVDEQATAYVCRGTFCSLPNSSRETLGETLRTMRKQSGN